MVGFRTMREDLFYPAPQRGDVGSFPEQVVTFTTKVIGVQPFGSSRWYARGHIGFGNLAQQTIAFAAAAEQPDLIGQKEPVHDFAGLLVGIIGTDQQADFFIPEPLLNGFFIFFKLFYRKRRIFTNFVVYNYIEMY